MYIAIFEFSIQLSFSQYLFYSTNLLVLLPLPKEKIVDYGPNNNSTRSDRFRRPSRTWLLLMLIRQIHIPGTWRLQCSCFSPSPPFREKSAHLQPAHYYDRTKANRFEELFGGTWIGEHPTKEHNQYLVIRYDFSAMVMANDMEGLAKNFDALNCSPVEIMVKHNRDLFGDFQFTNWGNAFQMLEEALAYIRLYGLPKAYILIDEYDNFTNQLLTSYNDPLYEKVTTSDSFLRTFFKVIKKGIGEGTVRTCFCTVYCLSPWMIWLSVITAEILTLEPSFLNMLGFTMKKRRHICVMYLINILPVQAKKVSRKSGSWLWATTTVIVSAPSANVFLTPLS